MVELKPETFQLVELIAKKLGRSNEGVILELVENRVPLSGWSQSLPPEVLSRWPRAGMQYRATVDWVVVEGTGSGEGMNDNRANGESSVSSPANVEPQMDARTFFAKLHCDLNTSSHEAWPADRIPAPHRCDVKHWSKAEQDAYEILRERITREIHFAAAISAMSVCQMIVSEREISRYWNVVHCKSLSQSEWEKWWDSGRKSEALPVRDGGKA